MPLPRMIKSYLKRPLLDLSKSHRFGMTARIGAICIGIKKLGSTPTKDDLASDISDRITSLLLYGNASCLEVYFDIYFKGLKFCNIFYGMLS